MKTHFSRRDFHLGTLSLPVNGILNHSPTHQKLANSNSPHFFINIMCKGGMDATLSFDPKVHHKTTQEDIFLEYRSNEIVGPKSAPLGPGASPLLDHIDDICIFNGVVMREPAAHDLQKLNISSGKGDHNCPNYCAEISYSRNQSTPILVKGPISLGNRNIEVVSFGSFKRELSDLTSKKSSSFNQIVKQVFSTLDRVRPAQKNYFRYLDSLFKARQMVKNFSLNVEDDSHVIAVALASEAVTTVSYFMDEEFDTHANHVKKHIELQKSSFSKISNLINTLKKLPYGSGSIFENTTMAVTTEFSRTPYLNGKDTLGKDHNFMTNSVFLAGKGIRGGQTVGSSFIAAASEREEKVGVHIGNFYDYKNSRSVLANSLKSTDDVKRQDLSFIYPENFAATIYKNFDIPIKQTQIYQKAKAVSKAIRT